LERELGTYFSVTLAISSPPAAVDSHPAEQAHQEIDSSPAGTSNE